MKNCSLIFTYISFLFFIMIVQSCGQKYERIEGRFVINEILNEPYNAAEYDREKMKLILDSLNVRTIEKYIKILISAEDEKYYIRAENLKNSDPFLREQPERIISILYSLHNVYRVGLLFNPCITVDNENKEEGTQNIYMDDYQFKLLEKKINAKEEIELEVEFMKEAGLTKFKIYRLKNIIS